MLLNRLSNIFLLPVVLVKLGSVTVGVSEQIEIAVFASIGCQLVSFVAPLNSGLGANDPSSNDFSKPFS